MGKVKWDEKRCQMLLRMAITRIRQQRTKSQERNKIAKKAVAELLEKGEERRARIKVLGVIQEDYMVEAFNIVEICAQTVSTRIEMLTVTKECPLDIKEHVCGLLFAAPKMSVTELTQASQLIVAKYGKQLPCQCVKQQCVNSKLVQRLKNQRPSDALINYYLSAIAKKHNVNWSLDIDAPNDPIEPQESDASSTLNSADLIDMEEQQGDPLDEMEARFAALNAAPSASSSELPPLDEKDAAAEEWDREEARLAELDRLRELERQRAREREQAERDMRMEPHPQFGTFINLYSHAQHTLTRDRLYPPRPVPVVIDNGSAKLRAGFAGEYSPRCVMHNIVGRPTQQETVAGESPDVFVGDEAHTRRAILDITSPLKHGIVVEWGDMARVLHHVLRNELRVEDIRQHAVVLTEPQYNSARCRAEAARVLFERFGARAVWFGSKPSLALYGSGRTSGLLLDCGPDMCQALPVWQGRQLVYAAGVAKTGGHVLSEHLGRMLRDSGHAFVSGSERAQLDRIRERLCYLPTEFDSELERAALSSDLDAVYEMPDGQSVLLGSERIRCTEPLYSPAMVGQEGRGIAHLVLSTVMKCEVEARQTLLQNIVLSGGLSLTTGFAERLATDIRKLLPPDTPFCVCAAPDRDLLTWQGASMLASGASFPAMCITQEQYREKGDALFQS